MKVFFKSSMGQTLIELLVVTSIIIGLTSLLILYNRSGERIFRLNSAAQKLVFDIRRAQNFALAVREVAPEEIPCSYAVNFTAGSSDYQIFADRALNCATANLIMDPGEEVENIVMEEGVIIQSSNIQAIHFVPPHAKVKFLPSGITEGIITLSLSDNPTITRSVRVTSAGDVSIF
jgi:Tfp pilus assembly protein FimT